MRWTGQERHSLVDPRESWLWCNWRPWEFRPIRRQKQDLPFIPERCPISGLHLTPDRTRCSLLCNIFPCLLMGVCTQMLGSPRYLWPAFLRGFFLPFVLTADKHDMWRHLDWPLVTSLIRYLKSGPPQLHDMSSKLKLWFERSMITSMALDLSRAIWSSAVSSLKDSNHLPSANINLLN